MHALSIASVCPTACVLDFSDLSLIGIRNLILQLILIWDVASNFKTFSGIRPISKEFGEKMNMEYNATKEMKKIYQDLGIPGGLEGYFDTSDLDVPATMIVGSPKCEGRILYKFAKRDYTIRAPGSAIIRELTRINQTMFG